MAGQPAPVQSGSPPNARRERSPSATQAMMSIIGIASPLGLVKPRVLHGCQLCAEAQKLAEVVTSTGAQCRGPAVARAVASS